MIKTVDAIAVARSLIGTSYSELDCINFIKKVIRMAPGGDKKYTVAGTSTLWASYHSSGKYKHLTWIQESINDPKPGMLAFKGEPLGRDGEPHHIGLVTSPTTVIHSSSTQGGVGVIETNLLNGQWTLLAKHRYIDVSDSIISSAGSAGNAAAVQQALSAASRLQNQAEVKKVYPYQATVVTKDMNSTVNLRTGPSKDTASIAKIPAGTEITVNMEFDGWDFIQTGNLSGFMSSDFIRKNETAADASIIVPTGSNEYTVNPSNMDASGASVPSGSGQAIPSGSWLEDASLVSETGASIFLNGRWHLGDD